MKKREQNILVDTHPMSEQGIEAMSLLKSAGLNPYTEINTVGSHRNTYIMVYADDEELERFFDSQCP
jgi:hypothetical protein